MEIIASNAFAQSRECHAGNASGYSNRKLLFDWSLLIVAIYIFVYLSLRRFTKSNIAFTVFLVDSSHLKP